MKSIQFSAFTGVGILSGGIIGAGVFALPYVTLQVGLIPAFGYLALGTIAFSIVHKMYADIVLGMPGKHRFVGYLERYLGKSFFVPGIFMAVLQTILTLLIYLVLAKTFIVIIAPTLNPLYATILFWAIGSVMLFVSLRKLAAAESFATIGILCIIGTIFGYGITHPASALASPIVFGGNFLLPLPVILFALAGRAGVIPVLDELRAAGGLARSPHVVRTVLTAGTVLPAVLYSMFILGVLALSPRVSPDSITGLVGNMPPVLLFAIGILGLLSLLSSYLLSGVDVNNTLRYDFKIGIFWRILLVVVAPLGLYLLGLTSFIGLISFVGGIFLSIEGILIVVMWLRARRVGALGGIVRLRSTGAVWLIILLFVVALIAVLIG